MIDQLSLFGVPIDPIIEDPCDLPEPILQPEIEEAIAALREIKKEVIAQFQIGTRITAGDLHGEITGVIDEMLCMVLFDGESKPRQVFTDSLSIEYKPVLVEGCIVRSCTAFKGKTAKILRFEQIHEYRFAVVEIKMYGSLIEYSCNIDSLEVVECS